MDDNYQAYISRITRLTNIDTYISQLPQIKKSPKFDQGKATEFPGYSIITPLAAQDTDNTKFYQRLSDWQNQLAQSLPADLVVWLPKETYHLTIADLIWDRDYVQATQANPQFESQLQTALVESFNQYQQSKGDSRSVWQIIGLSVRVRSLIACLVPKDEASYETILDLRRHVYQNSTIVGLGIEQQYHYTPHITLGYFNQIPNTIDYNQISQTLLALNDRWFELEPPVSFEVKQVELRKFDDMIHYYRQMHYPVIHF